MCKTVSAMCTGYSLSVGMLFVICYFFFFLSPLSFPAKCLHTDLKKKTKEEKKKQKKNLSSHKLYSPVLLCHYQICNRQTEGKGSSYLRLTALEEKYFICAEIYHQKCCHHKIDDIVTSLPYTSCLAHSSELLQIRP